MQKRSSITTPDTPSSSLVQKLAKGLSGMAKNEDEGLSDEVRHLIAVALGRQGGLKGGKARAKKLSAQTRSDIAKKAAETRWSNRARKK